MPAEWNGPIDSQSAQAICAGMGDDDVAILLAPQEMPYEILAGLRSLKQRLTPQPSPACAPRAWLVTWPLLYSELTNTRAVRLSLQGRVMDCPCGYCKAGMHL